MQPSWAAVSSDRSLLAKCSSHRCRWDGSFSYYLSYFSIIVCSMLLNFAVVGMELECQAMVANTHAPGRTRSWLSVYKMSQILSVQVCCAQISVVFAPCRVLVYTQTVDWSHVTQPGPVATPGHTGQTWARRHRRGIIELSADWGFMTKCQIFWWGHNTLCPP